MSARGRWKCFIGPALLPIWIGAVVAGMLAMVRYETIPAAGNAGPPRQWPAGLHVATGGNRMTLVMSLHPECPCSRASVHELEILMARSGDQLASRVLFVMPRGAPADWTDTSLWRQAKAIPGVDVAVDPEGRDSRALGATTSGQVEVYDTRGGLLFSGGITDSRGHEGDNDGVISILTLLHGGRPLSSHTPVFGCALESSASASNRGL